MFYKIALEHKIQNTHGTTQSVKGFPILINAWCDRAEKEMHFLLGLQVCILPGINQEVHAQISQNKQ